MTPFGIDLAQLGDLPIAVAIVFVVLVAFYLIAKQTNDHSVKIEQIRAAERQEVERQRSQERSDRDSQWRQFLRDERELDRTIGKSTAEMYSGALESLGAAITDQSRAMRDQLASLSETTRTEVNRLSDGFLRNAASVEANLLATRDDIRSTMQAATSAQRDTNAMLFRVGQDLQTFSRLIAIRQGAAPDLGATLDHFAGNSGAQAPKDEEQ